MKDLALTPNSDAKHIAHNVTFLKKIGESVIVYDAQESSSITHTTHRTIPLQKGRHFASNQQEVNPLTGILEQVTD